MTAPNNVRGLLKAIGIGDYNATMIIQYAFVAPATTDPRSSPIIIMVRHLQGALNDMGASVPVSGYLDQPTAAALARVVGPNWERLSWADNIRAVVAGRGVGFSASAPAQFTPALTVSAPAPAPVGMFDLPDVPGGAVTYAAAAVLAWHLFFRKKAI